jgi:hypothetical protein
MNTDDARIILALAAEADDELIWDRLKGIHAGMFAAGPVQIKFAYFGREGAMHTRPCITTSWITDADQMQDIMDRGRAGCVCGCYVNIDDIFEQALQEARRGPVQAVVIVGDYFCGNLDYTRGLAKQLRTAGTRLFLFQQESGHSARHSDEVFKMLAKVTGGAHFRFNPHIERVAERLPGMLEAVTHFAIGGTDALAQAQDDGSALLLLDQILERQQISQKD